MPITIKLDADRSLKWTMLTDFRLGSLERSPDLNDIGSKNPRKRFFALCCYLWACLEGEHPFLSPEDVAPLLQTPEEQMAAIKAVYTAMEAAGMIKHARADIGDLAKKKDVGSQTGSQPGPSESSSSTASVPTSGG